MGFSSLWLFDALPSSVCVDDDLDEASKGLGEVGVKGEALAVKNEAPVEDTKLCLCEFELSCVEETGPGEGERNEVVIGGARTVVAAITGLEIRTANGLTERYTTYNVGEENEKKSKKMEENE
jgi:hypothetical protein